MNEPTEQEILDEFQKHGMNASYHYADDSGKEWQLGSVEADKCRAMVLKHPELADKFRNIARHFLFSMEI